MIRRAVALLVVVLVVACGSTAPSGSAAGSAAATPSGGLPSRSPSAPAAAPSATPAIPGLSWVKAPDVARPDDAFADGPATTTGPAGPGTAGHPSHFPGQALVDDVTVGGNRLVAVGYVAIEGVWTAIAWTSTDGSAWRLSTIDDAPGSFAVAVTGLGVDGGNGFLAVGRSGRDPAAWTSADGVGWTRRVVPILAGDDEAERIVAVDAGEAGILAGGSVGPEIGDRRARFWRSTDGITWTPVPDDPSFDGGEVVAIARTGGAVAALGRVGPGQRPTSSIAWTSADGARWARSDSADLAAGLVAAVARAPDATLVAVGSDADEREALAWTSADGRAWSVAPGEPSRLYADGGKIRMTDVTAVPGGLVAVGNFVGLQFGTATSWTSADGRSWTRAPSYPALGQGEMLGLTLAPVGLVAVGSYGAPDNYIPTVWLGPAPSG